MLCYIINNVLSNPSWWSHDFYSFFDYNTYIVLYVFKYIYLSVSSELSRV